MTNTTDELRLSVSQLRSFMHCGYAWKLIHERGHLRVMSAATFFGGLMHEVIRLAYGGLPMEAAHREVWERACDRVLPALEQWEALSADYALVGKPQTKAAQHWRADHPEYDELLRAIRTFQETALGHLRWGETTGLHDYYRRAVALLDYEPDLLLPHPMLVEGMTIDELGVDAEGTFSQPDDTTGDKERDEEPRVYRPLCGTIGGISISGVPDIVALHPDGTTIRVGDYKTGRPVGPDELAEDAQLAIYVALLRQHGTIAPGQKVEVGHIYLTEHGPLHVWVSDARLDHVLRRVEQQLQHTAALIRADLVISRKGVASGFLSPCTLCDVAHVCDA